MKKLSQRLILAQGLDVLTLLVFMAMVPVSIHEERNPLILALITLGGIQLVGLVKIGVAAWVGYRATRQKVRSLWYQRVLIVGMSAATASGIVGAGFNTASIINSLTNFAIRI